VVAVVEPLGDLLGDLVADVDGELLGALELPGVAVGARLGEPAVVLVPARSRWRPRPTVLLVVPRLSWPSDVLADLVGEPRMRASSSAPLGVRPQDAGVDLARGRSVLPRGMVVSWRKVFCGSETLRGSALG
jgi:hypothetical protein